MFAPGPRPLRHALALRSLGGSRYNHVTGEVALDMHVPAEAAALRLEPVMGMLVVAQIRAALADAPDAPADSISSAKGTDDAGTD